jgi:hypothetical protein
MAGSFVVEGLATAPEDQVPDDQDHEDHDGGREDQVEHDPDPELEEHDHPTQPEEGPEEAGDRTEGDPGPATCAVVEVGHD